MKASKEEEKIFLELLREYNYLTAEEIAQGQEIQRRLPAEVFIGEILHSHGFLSGNQYRLLKTIFKYKKNPTKKKSQSFLTKEEKRRDRVVAELMLKENFLLYEELKKSLELQKALLEYENFFPLINILIIQGYFWENPQWENWQQTRKPPPKILLLRPYFDQGKVYLLSKQDCSIEIVGKDEVSLGRVEGADLEIPDPKVSRFHCKLVFSLPQKSWQVVDMMSSFGTFVNDRKIHRQEISDNDILRLAHKEYLIKEMKSPGKG